jgi:CTP:molybdopterin cytidylyltransferase MocA
MGGPKLLLPFRGKPLLAWVLGLVESLPLERRLIVLGAQADEILAKIFAVPRDSLPTRHPSRVTRNGHLWEVLVNSDWNEGMGSSLRLAAGEVSGGMLVFLGDMPLVPREAVLAVLSRTGERPVAPSYKGQRGFPVYLPASLQSELLALRGDIGARKIIDPRCELIPTDDPGVVLDIDDEADLGTAENVFRLKSKSI